MNEATTQSAIDDQVERINIIRHVGREFLAGEWSNERFRSLIKSGEGYDSTLWRKVCELGWPGLLLPEGLWPAIG